MEYTNRYGDVYTFTKQEDGSVLWEGDFSYCRFGWPNVYKPAYQQYCKDVAHKDEPPMNIEEFIDKVHDTIYNDNHEYVGPGPIKEKYAHLVFSDTNVIDMVDPSGGPFLKTHVNLYQALNEDKLKGLYIKSFKPIDTGYKINTYRISKELQ